MKSIKTAPTPFRTDIQALRGLAVLLVLLHHAEVGPFPAGYLGVDIFFVISGFLITRIVRDQIEAGTFSFTAFYFRRAKRLLPAAYACFFFTALFAPFILGVFELKDFAKQLLGALTFTANFALLRQAGYFEGAAELKPLLHVWSLAIEEQYYLLLPAAMVWAPPRFWLKGALVILAASLILCLVWALSKPAAAFYLLPARAWELAIGSIAALAVLDGQKLRKFFVMSFWPALFVLILLPIFPLSPLHPGPNAVAICIATLLVILRRHEWTNSSLICVGLGKVGDCSYSLYLAHWPILAFLNNAYLGKTPYWAHAAGLAGGVVAGVLLYRYVELPTRRATWLPSKRYTLAAVGSSVILVLIGFGSVWTASLGDDYAHLRRSNYGFSRICEFGGDFIPKEECRNSATPSVIIWGDSYAMHLVPGIAATSEKGVIQATNSLCGPFLDIAPLDDRRANLAWAKTCLDFNESVVDYIAATPSIEVVVMSSAFLQYLHEAYNGRQWRLAIKQGDRLVENTLGMETAVDSMIRTVERISALGKRILIIGPPPASGFDTAECQERKASGKPLLGEVFDCRLRRQDVDAYQGRVHEFLARVATGSAAQIVSIERALCGPEYCATELDGRAIYRDAGHLSYEGSQAVAEKMALGRLVGSASRE